MKVKIELTLEVDREDWDLAYGTDGLTTAEIRHDVKDHVGHLLDGALAETDNGARVSRFQV